MPSAAKSSLRASLEVGISKSGKSVGTLELPDLRPHQRCTFGRGPEADVKLEHASLSRLHADLALSLDGVVTLTDLASGALTSGTIASIEVGAHVRWPALLMHTSCSQIKNMRKVPAGITVCCGPGLQLTSSDRVQRTAPTWTGCGSRLRKRKR